MTAVRFRRVGFAYPHGAPVLEIPDLAVEEGELVVVVGRSGSGKSTLLRAVNGLVPHGTGGRFRGEVTVAGRSTRDHKPRDLVDVVGFVHQDPEAQFVADQVETDLAFALENQGIDQRTMRRRVEDALDALGIAHLRNRSPATLSGGEQQRCAIAGALAAAPEVLVLDEPTSQLDPQGATDVLTAVERLNADLGTTVIVAEHRLERAGPLADRALLIERGTVAADGPPADILTGYDGAPPVVHLGHLLGWQPAPLTVRQARRFAARDENPHAARLDAARRARTAGTTAAGSRPLGGEVVVRTRRASAELGGRPVLQPTDLELRAGAVVALLGRNGAGKTTLLRLLAGLLDPTTGAVERRQRVAYVPQDPNALLFQQSARAEVGETLRLLRRRDPGAVDQWLTRLGLDHLAERHPRTLSTGERQRLAIAAVAVGGAPVLLLDEPTRGMDAPSRAALESAVADHAAGGGTVVLATHDVELAARCATEAIVLGDGDVVAAGPAEQVLAGSLFAPQILRVLPPLMTVAQVAEAIGRRP